MRENRAIQPTPCTPAAQYVRISTEDQRYSVDNQIAGIGEYAAKHGFTIIRTYEDSGKSGLVLSQFCAVSSLRTGHFECAIYQQ